MTLLPPPELRIALVLLVLVWFVLGVLLAVAW